MGFFSHISRSPSCSLPRFNCVATTGNFDRTSSRCYSRERFVLVPLVRVVCCRQLWFGGRRNWGSRRRIKREIIPQWGAGTRSSRQGVRGTESPEGKQDSPVLLQPCLYR